MRRLWLHIGSHKTGTSTLQRNLRQAKNHRALGGYRYIHVKGKFQANPIVVPAGAGPDMTFTLRHDLLERLIHAAGDGDAVLSTEMLFWLYDPAQIQALADQLYQHFDEIRVVVYLRRQEALALSHRKQVVMGVAALDFYGCQIAALPDYAPHLHRYFDYAAKLALWEAAFGAEALVVRRFETGLDTVADFFDLIGVPFKKRVEDVNEAMSRSAVLAGLWLRQKGYVQRSSFEPLLYAIKDVPLRPARADAQAFHDHFRASNMQLAARYDPGGPPAFFSADFSRYPETGNDQLVDLTVDLDALEQQVRSLLATGQTER
jgi:hypothetical protein